MEKKISAYHKMKNKLEAENSRLRSEIRILVLNELSPEAMIIKLHYKLEYETMAAIWRGVRTVNS